MTIDEAIQHCEEVADTPCFTDEEAKCYSEHRQLAEWLKELKAYREKLNCTDCVIDGTDACPRGAGRAVDDEICGDFMPSSSEIPNTCGDAISREELIEALNTWDKFGYAPTHELIPLRGSADKDKYVPYIHYDDVIKCIKGMPSVTKQPCDDAISRQAAIRAIEALQRPIMREESNYYQFKFSGMSEALEAVENLPSVTPQQRTGRWIKQNYGWNWQCSECGFVTPPSAKEIFTFCPNCGAKMEVEDAD